MKSIPVRINEFAVCRISISRILVKAIQRLMLIHCKETSILPDQQFDYQVKYSMDHATIKFVSDVCCQKESLHRPRNGF